MIARVPLFTGLTAAEIAEITRLLRAQTVDAGGVIVRRGDPGSCMYFVAGGEVEIELREGNVRLGVGNFFGEIAVLKRSRRTATVRALTRVNLLVLDGEDLHALMENSPGIATRMREVMRERIRGKQAHYSDDIVEVELDQPKAPAARARNARKR
jgi:voltage-gated potassium channel